MNWKRAIESSISSEGQLSSTFYKYQVNISPDKMHDLLYYASLYVGEGATMAVESALLGTPSIYISSLAGTMGNLEELENKYGLINSYSSDHPAIDKIIDYLRRSDLKEIWKKRKETS